LPCRGLSPVTYGRPGGKVRRPCRSAFAGAWESRDVTSVPYLRCNWKKTKRPACAGHTEHIRRESILSSQRFAAVSWRCEASDRGSDNFTEHWRALFGGALPYRYFLQSLR